MSPLPVPNSKFSQSFPSTSSYSSEDLYNPLAGPSELNGVPYLKSPHLITSVPEQTNPLDSTESSQDFPMSPDLHTDHYLTSPQLTHPMFNLNIPNMPSNALYPDSEFQDLPNPLSPHLVNPLTSPQPLNSYQKSPYSSQETFTPLSPSFSSLRQDLFNPLASGSSENIYNPSNLRSSERQFTSGSSQSESQDLFNPLNPGRSEDLFNPLTPQPAPSSSSGPNRSPVCDQVAGPPRPVALSRLPAGVSGGQNPSNHRFEIGATTPPEMASPVSPPSPAAPAPQPPHQLYATLSEYLLLEHKFQPRLCLPTHSDKSEVTAGARSGAAHVLRCLAVWFDLPPSVLFTAISLLDRFLTKMRVRPCHVACITVSCMKLALERAEDAPPVTVEELVSVSQSACTAGDVTRMCGVIADKLAVTGGEVTALHWLRLTREIVACAASELGLPPVCEESVLVKQLEIVLCDAACANLRLSELALVLVFNKIEQQMVEWSASGLMAENAYYLYELGAQLQQHCRMTDESLSSCRSAVMSALSRYEASAREPHRQRLVWKLSTRTLRVLRPTERLTSVLPTIEEQHNGDASSPRTPNRNRSGSESSENEETSDWPRSPVLPVYCDN